LSIHAVAFEFCIEWLVSNSKEDLKSFGKWLWKIGKRKREGNPILFGFLA
jgi:hypothetical protein